MTPIEKLVKMTEDPIPEPPTFESGNPLRIEKFEDLKVGMRVEVFRRGRFADKDSWTLGTVRDITETVTMSGVRTWEARIKVDCPPGSSATAFIRGHRWDRQDRHRIRRAPDMVIDAKITLPTPEARPEGYKGMRQAAKSMNFGQAPFPPPVDGMLPEVILATFTAIMREEISPTVYNMLVGAEVPRLTERQVAVARMMWSQRVTDRVKDSVDDARRRERERVVVDDDRWEV